MEGSMLMKMLVVAVLGVAFATAPAPASAEVKQSAADGFTLGFARTLDVPPARAYAAIASVDRWWSGEHTYSGDARNLTLGGAAGDCFCERWKDAAGRDNSVRHGVVLMALTDQAFRIEGALGPLQGLGVNAVLSIGTRAEGAGTLLTMVYKVNGSAASGLDKLAPAVDAVLQAQFTRLGNLVATGKAD
jgi:hypothetical protein